MYGLASLAFLVMVAYLPGLPSNAHVGRWWVATLGALIMLWSAGVVMTLGHWMWLALLGWCLAVFTWTVSGYEHAWGLLHLAMMALVYAAASCGPGSFRPVWAAVAIGVGLSAPVAVAQALGVGTASSWHTPFSWSSWPVWAVNLESASPGLFLSKNLAADAATVGLIGALVLSVRSPRLLWLVPGPAVLACLSNARTVLLGLIVFVASWALMVMNRVRGLLACAGVLLAAALFLVARGGVGQLSDRTGVWAFLAPHVSPWGDGLESISIAATGLVYAHNEPLQFAFELGLPSVLLWGVFAHALLRRPVDAGAPERAALLALLVQSLVSFNLHTPVSAFMAAALAGWLAGRCAPSVRAEHLGRGAGVPGAEPVPPNLASPLAAHERGGSRVPPGSQHKVVA